MTTIKQVKMSLSMTAVTLSMAQVGSCNPRAAKIKSTDKTQWSFLTTKIATMTTSPKGRGIATGNTSVPIPLIKSELFVS